MDTIGNFLTSLRNAVATFKSEVSVPYSKLRWAIANVLKEEGYLGDVKKVEKPTAQILMYPIYHQKSPAIQSIQRVSRPGLRIYRNTKTINVARTGKKTLIVSTSRGVMSGSQAKKKHLGGEIICQVE